MKFIKYILICCIWGIALYNIPHIFFSQSTPEFTQKMINDGLNKTTPLLHPGDSVRQSFQLDEDYLESVSLAFAYDDSALNLGSMIIQFYQGEDLVLEQPLILAACPQNTFFPFYLDLGNCKEEKLTIQITNVSEDKDSVFSLMSTANIYAYQDFSDGYLFNNTRTEEGSILCSFNLRTGYNYYVGLTYVFFLILGAIALTRLIDVVCSWLQQRKYH